jgi:hypothetical protein
MSPTQSTTSSRASSTPARSPASRHDQDEYVVPLVHVKLPSSLVEKGFWGTLIGATALGAVDPPLAALVGAGALIARHRRS